MDPLTASKCCWRSVRTHVVLPCRRATLRCPSSRLSIHDGGLSASRFFPSHQLGTNPDQRNHKSYRPIDLAARRGHVECERLLSEYHMHHSTDNYFDSVLFLATVQVPATRDNGGQRTDYEKCPLPPCTLLILCSNPQGQQTSHAAIEALDDDGQYEIIRRANPMASDEEVYYLCDQSPCPRFDSPHAVRVWHCRSRRCTRCGHPEGVALCACSRYGKRTLSSRTFS